MQASPPETPYPPFGPISTGSFLGNHSLVGWRKHGTNDWQILYTLRGRGRFGTSRGDLTVRAGDIVLLQPRVPHDYGALALEEGPWEVRWVHFLPLKEWLPWLQWTAFSPGVRHLQLQTPELQAVVLERFLAMERFSRSPLQHADQLVQTALQEIILHCDTCHPLPGHALMDDRIRQVLGYVSDNLAEPLDVAKLAASCHLSKSRFSHLFQRETGRSPQRYLEELRLRHAMQLLRATGHPVFEIAHASGYEDPLYFSNRFRRYAGMSPREFRRSLE